MGYTFLPSARYVEMLLNLTHRAYITPIRGFRMGILPTSKWFRCKSADADLYHCMWSCPKVQRFWERINSFVVMHLTNIAPSGSIWAIFGYLDKDDHPCTLEDRRLLHMVAAAGSKTILHTWLQEQQPSF